MKITIIMPQKTKKEKIIASLRKNRQMTITHIDVPKSISLNYNTEQNNTLSPLQKYFLKDIIKSLLLIAIIITVEITLSFARIIK